MRPPLLHQHTDPDRYESRPDLEERRKRDTISRLSKEKVNFSEREPRRRG
jgi:hypothetical protein